MQNKLKIIAKDTNSYLKRFIERQKKSSNSTQRTVDELLSTLSL